MNIEKRKLALDRALEKKLYKIGEKYGKQLSKIYGKKYANDIAIQTAKNIIKLNKKAVKDASFSDNLNQLKAGWNYARGIEPDMFFSHGQNIKNFGKHIVSSIANVPRNILQNATKLGEGILYPTDKYPIKGILPSVGKFSTGKKLGDIYNKISGAAQNAVNFGGTQAANFGKSISNMVGGISPKAAELFAKYPKTTGLAAAAALLGAGYGVYKHFNNESEKNKRSK